VLCPVDFEVASERLDVVELSGVVHHVHSGKADHAAVRCFSFAEFEFFVELIFGDLLHCGDNGIGGIFDLLNSGFFGSVRVGADRPVFSEGPGASILAFELGGNAVIDDNDLVSEIVTRAGFSAGRFVELVVGEGLKVLDVEAASLDHSVFEEFFKFGHDCSSLNIQFLSYWFRSFFLNFFMMAIWAAPSRMIGMDR
jgi:hypothetical protein